jgi:hypothetical protein
MMMMLLKDFGNYVQTFECYLYHCCIYRRLVVGEVFAEDIFLVLAANRIYYWNCENIDLNSPVDELMERYLDFLEHLMLYFFRIS